MSLTEGLNVLDSRVIRIDTHHERHSWVRGHVPDTGTHIQGLQGPETFISEPVIKPVSIFEVREPQDRAEEAEVKHDRPAPSR